MRFFINLVTDVFYFFSKWFSYNNYYVRRATMEYMSNGYDELTNNNSFWYNESKQWDEEPEENFAVVTWWYNCNVHKTFMEDAPDTIIDFVFRITYLYNNKVYKYITLDQDHVWPPVASRDISYNPPLKSVTDENGEDVTDIIKKFAGPRNNFHGETINLKDIGFEKLTLTNILGQVSVVTETISRPKLWLPNKTLGGPD